MFCKHKWKVIDKTVLPSAFEQTDSAKKLGIEGIPGVLFYRKLIQVIIACERCGKLRKFTETNP